MKLKCIYVADDERATVLKIAKLMVAILDKAADTDMQVAVPVTGLTTYDTPQLPVPPLPAVSSDRVTDTPLPLWAIRMDVETKP